MGDRRGRESKKGVNRFINAEGCREGGGELVLLRGGVEDIEVQEEKSRLLRVGEEKEGGGGGGGGGGRKKGQWRGKLGTADGRRVAQGTSMPEPFENRGGEGRGPR